MPTSIRLDRPARASLAALVVLLAALPTAAQSPGPAPTAARLAGDVRHVHDPVVAKDRGVYYLYSTRAGIAVRCSTDLVTWRLCGDVFAHLPGWAVEAVPGLRGIWAPDIAYFNNAYHLYYSASTFGSNRSSIGLTTNRTLDPSSDQYRWADKGKVVSSSPSDDWNAIDPNVVLDEAGHPWLSFGSFWGGIKMRRLDPSTGMLDAKDTKLYALAARPRSASEPGAIEAPFIHRRGGYYYLFVSFDFCCRGVESTYNIRVGRARDVTGPYVDREGRAMLEGGGTPVLAGDARWRGPGHCAVFRDGDAEWLLYHAYDAEARGASTLRIDRLVWDADGWPAITRAGAP